MQTILGSGGSIGSVLAKELSNYTKDIRLVSRNPKAVNEADQLFPADLSNPEQVDKAIEGSEIVYAVIGFPYSVKVWKDKWPKFITAVVEGCKKHKAKLVFFDNIYMYDPEQLNGMTEETPHQPSSKKGAIRKQVVDIILESVKKGEIEALIARAPDFISEKNSVITEIVIRNYLKGKKAMWFSRLDKIHNFISMNDAAKATALLGNTKDAYNQTWHLPTDQTKYTGQDWINMVAKMTGQKPQVTVIGSFMLTLLGIFTPYLKEFKEMRYQFEKDYLFDSTKFEKRFGFKPTEARVAIQEVIDQVS